MPQQPIVTGNILSLIQNSDLTNPNNWKTLRPKSYDVYVTGIIEKVQYAVTLKSGQTLKLVGTDSIIVYGPTNQFHIVPIKMINNMVHEDGTSGTEFLKKHAKLAAHGLALKQNVQLAPTDIQQFKVLPWTRVSVTEPAFGPTYFGFKCPTNWRNIQVIATQEAFQYLADEYFMQGLILNKNHNDPDFIVVQGSKGTSPQNGISLESILKTARFYNSNTFAQMYDMRTFAGTDVDKIIIECPATLFTINDATEQAEAENAAKVNVQDMLTKFAAQHGYQVIPDKTAALQSLNVPAAVFNENVSAEDVRSKFESKKFDSNIVITIGQNMQNALNVVLKNEYDAIMLAKGYTEQAMHFCVDQIIPRVSTTPLSIEELLA